MAPGTREDRIDEAIAAAELERLRRSVDLHMHRDGRLDLDGAPVTHPRVDAMLRHGIDVTDSGELVVRWGEQWCYLRVDDLPFRVTGAEVGDAGEPRQGLKLRLDDGRWITAAPEAVAEDPEGLACVVPARGSGRPLRARFTSRALVQWAALVGSGGQRP
jgi:hypothetical protein